MASVVDFTIIEEAIHLFERVSGARLNPRKSKALAVGTWCTKENIFGIAYHLSVTILVVTFWGTIEQTMKDTWTRVTGKVRVQHGEPTLVTLAWQAGYVMSTPFSCPKSGITRKSCRPQTHTPNSTQQPLHGRSGEEQSSECRCRHYNDQNKWENRDD